MIIQILAHSLPFLRNFPGLLRLSLVFSLSHQTFFGCGSVPQSCPALCHPMAAAHQASLSFTVSRIRLKPMSIKSVTPSNHLILCRPLLLHLQFFPAPGSFQMSQLFALGGQTVEVTASASVLPMNIQD